MTPTTVPAASESPGKKHKRTAPTTIERLALELGDLPARELYQSEEAYLEHCREFVVLVLSHAPPHRRRSDGSDPE